MNHLRGHSIRNIDLIFLPFLLLFIVQCKEEEKKIEKEYVAKVGENILTAEDIKKRIKSEKYRNKFEKEYILDWAEREVLFLRAIEADIAERNDFKEIIDQSRKELAVSLYLQDYFSKKNIEVTDDDLESYFNDNLKEFTAPDYGYVFNSAKFISFDDALTFRGRALSTNWSSAQNEFINSGINIIANDGRYVYRYQISEIKLIRILEELNSDEISIIFESEPNHFTVVQMVDKIEKGFTPTFSSVKNEIRTRYLMYRRKVLYDQLVKDLFKQYDVEVKEGSIQE